MKKYEIRKNNHYSGLHFKLNFDKSIACQALFDDSCLYDLKNINNFDINKLFGFSTSYNHHQQSARLGWRRFGEKNIELLTYVYNDGVRLKEERLAIIRPYDLFTCLIEDNGDHYLFTYDDSIHKQIISIPKTNSNPLFRYNLWPYFGGNETAPHDMLIFLKIY